MELAAFLIDRLVHAGSLNEYLAATLPAVAARFQAADILMIDYKDTTDHFDLVHFEGFEGQSRHDLQHRLRSMRLRHALSTREAYSDDANPSFRYIPLYFTDVLEAVLVMQSTVCDSGTERLIGRFFGLLFSSNRLSVNRRGGVDVDDLHRARQIQLSYLPQAALRTDHFDVCGLNQSSALVGGDYFDYFEPRAGAVQAILVDASGHGMSAALIMSAFQARLRSEIADADRPGQLLSRLNDGIHSRGEILQYLTGVFLEFDPDRQRLTYANAGHFEPLVFRSNGQRERLAGGGPPIGMLKGTEFETFETHLGSGDLVVLFTDGLADLTDGAGNYFGVEGVQGVAGEHRNEPVAELASRIIQSGRDYSGVAHPEDDMTVLLLRAR